MIIKKRIIDEVIIQYLKVSGAICIEEAAKNLTKVCADIVSNGGKAPKIKCIICGLSNAAYKRPDGIFVVPLTSLKN